MKTMTMMLAPAALAVAVLATASTGQSDSVNVGSQLPPKVRGLLIQEMQAILEASQQIQAAIVQGHHETVATTAQAIHDSFIMDQQMMDADKQTLLATVPDDFLERDKALHELSADLAKAGRSQDTARQLQGFSKMMQGCVGCHSRYTTARFPGLATP